MTTLLEQAPARSARQRPTARRTVVALGILAVVVGVAAVWGGRLDQAIDMHLNAAPLFAEWRPRIGISILLPVVVAAAIIARSDLAQRLSFGRLLAACFAATCAWGVSLALVHGVHGLTMGIERDTGHLVLLGDVASPGEFLQTFTQRLDGYPAHVRSHPPGLVAPLWWLHRAGVGLMGFAGLIVAVGASAVVAVLIAAREVAGEAFARRAAPFLVLAPAALWLVTSMDAIYAAVAAWGIALVCLASGRKAEGDSLAVAGGVAFGYAMFISYGTAVLVLVPLAVAIGREAWRTLVFAGVGAAAVAVAFQVWGFSWLDGLLATRIEYLDGIAQSRPYSYFVLGNIAAFAIAVGPAAVTGLAHLAGRRAWILVGSALVAVLIADVSGMSKGEVERIWLHLWPWVGLAAGALVVSGRRWWLGAQTVIVVGMTAAFHIPW